MCYLEFFDPKNAEIKYKELKERLAKFEDYFAIVNKWLKNRNQHISVADYFKNNHYEKIAIYGMGEIGKRLYEELCAEGIEVTAVFDRNAQRLDPSINVYSNRRISSRSRCCCNNTYILIMIPLRSNWKRLYLVKLYRSVMLLWGNTNIYEKVRSIR